MTPALQFTRIELSPYLELRLLGFDVDLKTTRSSQFKLLMLRGDEVVSTAICARSANLSVDEALRRVKLNLWGPKTQMHKALKECVVLARGLTNKNA